MDTDTNKTILNKVVYLFYGAIAFLKIDALAFEILVFLMCFECCTSFIKKIRMGKKHSFESISFNFILKLLIIMLPLLIALMGRGINLNLNVGVILIMKFLIIGETYNILTNIYSIKTKKTIGQIDIFSLLILNLKKVLKKIIIDILRKIENINN